MKTYFANPELEVVKFAVEDVLTTSNDATDCDDDCFDDFFLDVAGSGNCF